MVEPSYITKSDVKAWLGPAEPVVVTPAPLATEAASPRLCLGCNKLLPPERKSFHNMACRGTWLHKRSPTGIKAAAKKEGEHNVHD